MESALNIQVGGNHYKQFSYQPVKFAVDMDLNFIQGNVVKYVSRYKYKNGNEDLRKVLHYAQLGLELAPRNYCPYHLINEKVKEFTSANNLSDTVGEIIHAACCQDWIKITSKVKDLYDYE